MIELYKNFGEVECSGEQLKKQISSFFTQLAKYYEIHEKGKTIYVRKRYPSKINECWKCEVNETNEIKTHVNFIRNFNSYFLIIYVLLNLIYGLLLFMSFSLIPQFIDKNDFFIALGGCFILFSILVLSAILARLLRFIERGQRLIIECYKALKLNGYNPKIVDEYDTNIKNFLSWLTAFSVLLPFTYFCLEFEAFWYENATN